jgi:drug/metabolite transporter (DMT)-like permease
VIEWLGARPRLAALAGAICIAFSGIFYRYAAVSPETGAVFRALYGLPILAVAAWLEVRRHGPLPAATVRLALVAGLFFAADLVFWHHAIEWVGAGLATVLGNLQVVVVAVAAWLLLGERPAARTLVALPVVLAGVVLISGILGRGAYGANPLLGVLFGALTALCYAGYLLVLRRGGRDLHRPVGPVAVSTFATVAGTVAMGAVTGGLDPVPSLPAHAWLAALGVVSQSFGSLFIAVSLPRLPAVLTSIILLAQPVAAVVLARILLGETPSLLQYGGVALVVGGIALATLPLGRTRNGPSADPAPALEAAPGP